MPFRALECDQFGRTCDLISQVSATQKVSLCCSTTDTLGSYRGLNQSEIVKGGPSSDWPWSRYSCTCVYVWRCVCCCSQTERDTKKIQIKLGWALFVTYTIIQSIMRSEMCSLHLTHPSVHTWSSGQPTVQRPGSSHGLPFGAGIRTHNLGLPRVSSPTLYPLGQRLPSDRGE